jgi:hypothetical protein
MHTSRSVSVHASEIAKNATTKQASLNTKEEKMPRARLLSAFSAERPADLRASPFAFVALLVFFAMGLAQLDRFKPIAFQGISYQHGL